MTAAKDLGEARSLVQAYMTEHGYDQGPNPLAVAPWVYRRGEAWLVMADTPRGLEGDIGQSVVDPPWFLVTADGTVEPMGWEAAQVFQDLPGTERLGPPEPEPFVQFAPPPDTLYPGDTPRP